MRKKKMMLLITYKFIYFFKYCKKIKILDPKIF